MRIDLSFGSYSVSLEEAQDVPVLGWPLWMFDPFLQPSPDACDLHFNITVTKQLPPLPSGKLVFDAAHGLWKLFEGTNFLYLQTLNTQTKKPFSCAIVSKDFSGAEVFVTPAKSRAGGKQTTGWQPANVLNPLVEICWLTKLARGGGFVMHAAALKAASGAWIFTGQSGAGKTTITNHFLNRGYEALTDERAIIRFNEDHFEVFGSPWCGEGHVVSNEHAPLSQVHFIRHGRDQHSRRRLSASEISRLFLKQCFLPHWDREAMEATAFYLTRLALQIPCFDTAPLNANDIVNFLTSHPQDLVGTQGR
jgi:hypothetical protein